MFASHPGISSWLSDKAKKAFFRYLFQCAKQHKELLLGSEEGALKERCLVFRLEPSKNVKRIPAMSVRAWKMELLFSSQVVWDIVLFAWLLSWRKLPRTR